MDRNIIVINESDEVTIQPLFSKWHDHQYFVSAFMSAPKILKYHSKRSNDFYPYNQKPNNELLQTPSLPPLFADNIWPGSLVLSDYLCNNHSIIESKICLELGAAFGLPSMVACSLGSKYVVVTDYPAPYLLENIDSLFQENGLDPSKYKVKDFIWGSDVTPLLDLISNIDDHVDTSDHLLSSDIDHNEVSSQATRAYDVIFLAELLWKDTYTQHQNLVDSVKALLSYPDGIALLSFAHRPSHDDVHKPHHDLEFLDRLCERSVEGRNSRRIGDNEISNSSYKEPFSNSYNSSSGPDSLKSSSSRILKASLLETSTKYCDVSEESEVEVFLFKISFTKPTE